MDRSDQQPASSLDLWDAQLEIFKSMTPPLRPHKSEVAIVQQVVTARSEACIEKPLQALILGLTPEFVGLEWPREGRVVLVDHSPHVIGEFWPGDLPGRREAVVADWLDMPFQPAEFDLIIGDGVFNFMSYPDGYRAFAAALSRLLRPAGLMCVRIFNQAVPKEERARLAEEYQRSERIDHFGFRYRLATSLQERPEAGIHVSKDAVDRYLVDLGITLAEFYEKSGYVAPSVPPLPDDTGDSFRVSYPTDRQFVDQIGGFFEVRERLHGDYPLAHRTPIFVASVKSR